MAVKGYVVRGTHRRGWPVFAYDHSGAFGGPSETDIPLHVFPSLDTASGARAHMVRCGCSDVAIFRVLDDGTEERLPSYEEALGQIERLKDPVDGLEAKLVERTTEREEARDWVRRLTREQRCLTCAFCGAEYPPGTPAANDEALAAHVRVCPKHPMREAEAEIERLRALTAADPLAALEAAERRLLEAGGWREDSPGWWNDGLAGVSTISTERRTVALTIERRRLAAKGGA